jgi:enoyl-CoA hydratase/carnithine racemase
MIGGTDLSMPIKNKLVALDVCLRLIRHIWPNAVYENALTGEKADRYEELAIGLLDELFVYQDERVAREWDEKGNVPHLENTMLHLLLSESVLTAVTDNPAEKTMRQLIESIRSALRMNVLNNPVVVGKGGHVA